MSVENLLERIAFATEQNNRLLESLLDDARNVETKYVETKYVETPIPAAVEVPAVPVPAAPKPEPVPQFAIPVPATPAPTGAPFTDAKGLTAYCMDKYKALGPVKGGMIQNTLLELGVQNIHQLPVEKYGEFFNKVEAL